MKNKQYKPGQLLTIKLWNLENVVVRVKSCESNYAYSPCMRCVVRRLLNGSRICSNLCRLHIPYDCYLTLVKPKSFNNDKEQEVQTRTDCHNKDKKRKHAI